jgi:excisionase family DNA binding protein
MTVTVEEKGMRIKEAAEFLGVKPGTIFKWVKNEPSFPKGVKVGKLRIFLKSDLVAFLAKKPRKWGK